MTTPTILIVDDEANIRLFLEDILSQDGYHIVTAETGEIAVEQIAQQHFDLALIDLKLPGIDGIQVLKAIRQKSIETMTIVLTAHASLDSAVEALRQGANDYLFKPCKPADLRDSVQKALFHRQSQARQSDLINQLKQMSRDLEAIRSSIVDEPPQPGTTSQPAHAYTRFLEHGSLTIDLLQHAVLLEGQRLDTTPTEFDLLVYLMQQAPRAVPPQELIQNIQGYDVEVWEASSIIRRHIHRLRQKINNINNSLDIIQTVRGIGYAIKQDI